MLLVPGLAAGPVRLDLRPGAPRDVAYERQERRRVVLCRRERVAAARGPVGIAKAEEWRLFLAGDDGSSGLRLLAGRRGPARGLWLLRQLGPEMRLPVDLVDRRSVWVQINSRVVLLH